MRGNLTQRARQVRERIHRWVGIPCGIGIAPTKTLAKLANFMAKTAERKPGSYPFEFAQVCNLADLPASDFDAMLAATEVREVWGVGPRIGQQLQEAGIHTVLDLTQLRPAMVRSRWSVTLEKTVRELQGQPCVDLDDVPSPKKEIACTRSFGHPVMALPPLIEAVSEFASRAAEKLRRQHSLTSEVLVFAHTSPYRPGPRFSKAVVVPLRRPTADTSLLVRAATAGLKQIYEPGFQLIKAGVMLLDLIPDATRQGELDLDDDAVKDRTRVMSAMDILNDRFGKGAVHVASTGLNDHQRQWGMRQERRTPQYTTCWDEVPMARA